MDSFSATFLGHHAWLLSAGRTALLVDPLLEDGFGHTPAVGLRVYPPRRLDLGRFPPVSGVVLTHEHEGHFDLPSLCKIDRSVPVWIPRGSSHAMRQILGELGFRHVRTMFAGDRVRIGELRVVPLPSDQLRDAIIDEWDSTAYLVYDGAGHGGFFAHVDMPVSAGMRERVHAELGTPPVVWVRTNNFHDCYFQYSFGRPSTRHLSAFVAQTVKEHQALGRGAKRPQALLLAGGGFAFPPDRPLNRNAFSWDSERAARALRALLPGERVLALLPGQELRMQRGALANVADETPFARCAPRTRWPDRSFLGDVAWLESYPAASEEAALAASGWSALERELDGFARYLYGRQTYRALYSLSRRDLKGKRPTFSIAALTGGRGAPVVYEYEPQGCRFRRVPDRDPFDTYLASYECWASDLLGLLRAELSPTTLSFARSRVVNHNPVAFPFALNAELFTYAHPLRMPDRFLELYRRVVQRASTGGQQIRGLEKRRVGRRSKRA